ncbi:MAG: hypothetical protein HFI37_08885 [Lachnospiraceae bacterium]|jgi:hypothetical protein|nr:hypothetical protein [Lachnospiraceae bacterium]
MLTIDQWTDELMFNELPTPGKTKPDLMLQNVSPTDEFLADSYKKMITSMTPDEISYPNRTYRSYGVTPESCRQEAIKSLYYKMFCALEELIVNHLNDKKEIWLYPPSKVPIGTFVSNGKIKNLEFDYFFAMDGGEIGFGEFEVSDKCMISICRREICRINYNVKKYSHYLKKKRTLFLGDFEHMVELYYRQLKKVNLDEAYRYARFCQLWCEAEGRKIPHTLEIGLKELNLAREQYSRIQELYPEFGSLTDE